MTWLTLWVTDLGIKKKKKKKAPKEGDDDFAAKLAALDLDKEGGEDTSEEPTQDGDMYAFLPCRINNAYPGFGSSSLLAGATKRR